MVIGTVGGGAYDLSAWVQWRQLRYYGYEGRYYLGYSDRQRLTPGLWDDEPVTPVRLTWSHGWQSKSLLVDAIPEPVVLFLDADVYPLGAIPRGSHSVCWPNVAGYCAINAPFFGLPVRSRWGLDGGLWVIDKQRDADVWNEYLRLNSEWQTTYQHGFGDQDLLLVAWERHRGAAPLVPSDPSNVRGVGRHCPASPWPGFLHRWRQKLTVASSYLPTLPDEALIRIHVRDYRRKRREFTGSTPDP